MRSGQKPLGIGRGQRGLLQKQGSRGLVFRTSRSEWERGDDSDFEELCDVLGSIEREDRDLPRTKIMRLACAESNHDAGSGGLQAMEGMENREVVGARIILEMGDRAAGASDSPLGIALEAIPYGDGRGAWRRDRSGFELGIEPVGRNTRCHEESMVYEEWVIRTLLIPGSRDLQSDKLGLRLRCPSFGLP